MQKPRRPKHYAPSYEWDRYWRELENWQSWRRQQHQVRPRRDPERVVDEVKAVYNPESGVTENFFGGEGRPEGDGAWHGHYDVDEDGNILYGRDPGERE